VIGVNPSFLEFGMVCPGQCADGELTLRNLAPDPESQLIIMELAITPPFSLVDPPQTPFTIPGDGSIVPLVVRYCATGSGSQNGALTIHALNAPNSPLVVPLNGIADPPPLCDHGGPYFGLPGEPVTFDGSASSDPGGEIVAYVWDFGDGATATGAVVVHTYPVEGTYPVRLEVTDNCGGVSTCQTDVHVSTNLPPICNAGGPYSGEAGSPIAMSGAGSSDPDGMIVVYRWSFGDGQTAFGVIQHHSYTLPGTYTVTLTVVDNEAASSTCTTTAHVTQSTPNQPPVCDAGGPYSGAVGQPILFDGSGSSDPDGTIVDYNWQFGDCGTGTGPNPTHTYATAAVYTVSLCVTDDGGRTSCCTAQVEVLGEPGPQRTALPFGKRAAETPGTNPFATLPLHAESGCGDCSIPIDCLGLRPTVNILPNTTTSIHLIAANFNALAAVQTAFEWDSGWTLLGSFFACVPGQVTAVVPVPPGGATAGTVATTFNCVTGGSMLVIGRLLMISGATGCLNQVQSSYPGGIHVVDCNFGSNSITSAALLGRICVGSGGYDACVPVIPVRPATWGQVKATYR
jgi:PKD repeat protein